MTAGAEVADYVEILKPRVMALVVFTGFVGLVVAPGHLHPVLAVVAVLCLAVGAGAAGAINMWYERDIDALMRRTAGRPLLAGRMMPGEALGFSVVLGVGAVLLMGLAVNWVAAELLALTIGFYVFVYTIWLKRRTPQNIVIGGAAGAFLGVVALPDRRLWCGRRTDAAGRRWAARNQTSDAAVHFGSLAGRGGALAARYGRRALRRRHAAVECGLHRRGDPGLLRRG